MPLEHEHARLILLINQPPFLPHGQSTRQEQSRNVPQTPDTDVVVVGAGGEEGAAGRELDDVHFVSMSLETVHRRDAGDVEH